mgnify:CR=1 FL=1
MNRLRQNRRLWIHCGRQTRRPARLLSHLMLLHEPLEQPRTIKIAKGRIETELAENPGFDLVVVDEAHHLYRDEGSRALVEKQVGNARRLILSDLSQSDGRDIPYPPMRETELTEVVRSSKRVVAGAMQFQLGGEAKLLGSKALSAAALSAEDVSTLDKLIETLRSPSPW